MSCVSFPLNSVISIIAVSIKSVLADGDILALSVRAVANKSVFNTSVLRYGLAESYAASNANTAASILLAKTILELQDDFSASVNLEADVSAFITFIISQHSIFREVDS
ncbi:hypothetical protein F4604DRAFT_964835 [Suillus subluteus]|nr:hypothetical protein F4604DRAFT_964835 [Suillus subluteus]